MTALTLQDVPSAGLLKDAAALAKRDPQFKDQFDRYCVSGSGMRATWAWVLMTHAIDEDRDVPWTGDEIIVEIQRRKAAKKATKLAPNG